MKINWISNLFILFIFLVLLIIIFYNRYLTQLELPFEPEINEDAPAPTSTHPIVQEKADELIQRSANSGITIVITDSFRSAEDQDRLYDIGRSVEGNIVTHAKGGESYHNFGLAVDFAIKTPTGDVIWDMNYDGNANGVADWTEVVIIAKSLGFKWGGDWPKFKDYPHLQMDFGLSIYDLQRGERPPESP
ncbi:M15 family metallopeptidase [Ureibacillus composti]